MIRPGTAEHSANVHRSLRAFTDTCYVIAHRENVDALCATLQAEGFACRVVRGPYSSEEIALPAIIRCLVNHRNAWRHVVESEQPALVVEADFVPVFGFGSLPAPLPCVPHDPAVGFAWLYSAGSILYGFDGYGYPHGHACTAVAYLLTPAAARALVDFADAEVAKCLADRQYRAWDTYFGVYLRWERGIRNHIPALSYGEHGGIAQSEHAAAGIRAWHQADRLAGRLAFLPTYARGSRLRYALIRLRAYARGWARVVLLRYFDPRNVNHDSTRTRAYKAGYAVLRLLLPKTLVLRAGRSEAAVGAAPG